MKLTKIWKRIAAQGTCLSLFGLVIAVSAESVPPGMDAPALACDQVVQDGLLVEQAPIVLRINSKAGPGWRALVPGIKHPRS